MAKDKKTPSIASQGAVMRRVLKYIGPHVSLVVLSLVLCLISVALTMAFTFAVCLIMRRHVKQISMVESMKAPE